MDNPLTIVHSNQLIEASYSLSINEMRLLMLASSQVDPRKKNVGQIKVYTSEFKDAFGFKGNHVYDELRNAAKSLIRKPIKLFSADEGKIIEFPWLVSNEYFVENAAYITLEFSPKVEPYLFELKDRFTSINFEYAAKLNTPFSFRLYQWLHQARNLKKYKKGEAITVELEVEWMKKQAMLVGYDRWNNFYEAQIKPSLDRINHFTDLSVIHQNIKRGRSVVAVRFTYVVDADSPIAMSKPVRPRLLRRPKVKIGTRAEADWMRSNMQILLNYEKELHDYDPKATMPAADLRKMLEYAKVVAKEEVKRIESLINKKNEPDTNRSRAKKVA